jgi:PAS domain S-box-containing protein
VTTRTAEIEAAHHRMDLAASAAGIGVFERKAGSDVQFWDERMHAIYGTSPKEFTPTVTEWLNFIYPEDREMAKEKITQATEQGTPYKHEYRIITADGSLRYIASHAIVLLNKEHKFTDMIGVNMDITTIKSAEDALRMTNAELERALRVKDEFLANMSHELRTPLNAILGLSESLEEQIAGPLNEKQTKYLHTISESGRHLLELINDILDLAKIEAGQIVLDMNKVNVKLLCQAATRMIIQLAQKKEQELTLEIDETINLIWADERRLKQMIVNLLSNAVKFTPRGGKVGIKVAVEHASNTVLITVWDNGIGIKDENLEHIFNPFVQLDSSLARESAGTGLGLGLVAQMARLHGGHIKVASTPGEGSQFTIALPWKPANQTGHLAGFQTGKLANQLSTTTENTPTILLVEDTEAVVMLLKDYLESAGYHVDIARDGLDGIAQTRLIHPDLILMDVMMPGMDGLEATRKIRSEPAIADIPIIGLTALAMSSDRERCLTAGMNDYMSKPIKLNELVSIIQRHLSPQEEQKP